MDLKSRTVETASINITRALAMDAVEKAASGHPGTPMSLAPVAYTIYKKLMRHNPENPTWPDRDRFILSAGHASMLHLTGYGLALEDLENFRPWESRTPEHPEHFMTPRWSLRPGPSGRVSQTGSEWPWENPFWRVLSPILIPRRE